MDNAHKENSVEQRRKLLKGALAASGVVTMGYSGAALASFECVAKVRTDGGFPIGPAQFTMTQPSGTAVPHKDWAWKQVVVNRYRVGTNTFFEGFEVNGLVYRTAVPPVGQERTPVAGATIQNNGQYPKAGWVLAYFTDGGDLNGTYPSPNNMAGPTNTPAMQSCLASINPHLNLTGFTFGG